MSTATMPRTEQDVRLGILNSLLTTPHRQLANCHPMHVQMVTQDPLFYVRLAAWYNNNGEIRDHKETFVVNLILSSFEGHRDVGLALLREMPPHQVCRVVDFISGKKEMKSPPPPAGTARPSKPKKGEKRAPTPPQPKTLVTTGLFKTRPRSLGTEIERYLREREADNSWFDSSVISARKYMKRLYSLFHITPSPRAQAILFEDKPPEDSTAAQLKVLAKLTDPTEQAKAIIEHKITYRVASTVVNEMTAPVLLALVEVMSPQELINNLSSLKKRGAFDNPLIKEAIDTKIKTAKKSKQVSVFKGAEAAKVGDLDESTQKALGDVADSQSRKRGRIKKSTALLIDKSASMQHAIELGKRIGAMIAGICENSLYVYAFDTMPYPIAAVGDTLTAWEKALKGISAGGGTACGSAISAMIRSKQKVEQIVIITDEEENNSPTFVTELQRIRTELAITPHVVIVQVTNSSGAWNNQLERQATQAGITHDKWQFNGDYMSLPGLIPFLTGGSKLDLLMDIMTYELPQRKAA